jgi:hypothetical protein
MELEQQKMRNADKEHFRPVLEKRVGHPLSLDSILWNDRLNTWVAQEEWQAETSRALMELEKAAGVSLSSLNTTAEWDSGKQTWKFKPPFSLWDGGDIWWAYAADIAPFKAVAGNKPFDKVNWDAYCWDRGGKNLVKYKTPKDKKPKEPRGGGRAGLRIKRFFSTVLLLAAAYLAFRYVPRLGFLARYVPIAGRVPVIIAAVLASFLLARGIGKKRLLRKVTTVLWFLIFAAVFLKAFGIMGPQLPFLAAVVDQVKVLISLAGRIIGR